MEIATVSSGFLAQTLDVVEAAIHPPDREEAARALRDELLYLLGVAQSRHRPGPAVLVFACPPRELRT